MCLLSFQFINVYEEEQVTLLSKQQKPEEWISTCGSGYKSNVNELVESKSETTTNKFQAIKDI